MGNGDGRAFTKFTTVPDTKHTMTAATDVPVGPSTCTNPLDGLLTSTGISPVCAPVCSSLAHLIYQLATKSTIDMQDELSVFSICRWTHSWWSYLVWLSDMWGNYTRGGVRYYVCLVSWDGWVCSCLQGGVEAPEKHNLSRHPGDFGY